jgi:hypothetical protein
MNVLIIPEDFRKDQYILKPIISAMLSTQGINTRVEVCRDPLLGGISQALRWERRQDVIEKYKYRVSLFILCVDRDGVENRRQTLDDRENKAQIILPEDKSFLAENAWQEIEVWVLAGHSDLPNDWKWADARQEIHPKEVYFQPFAEQKGVADTPDGGRRRLADEAAKNYQRIRQLCPEVASLETRLL